MRHAEIDQARFLTPADHLDRMTQRGFGRHQKRLRRTQLTHRVGCQGAHAQRRHVTNALAEPRQAFERALPCFIGETTFAIQAIGHAHGFAQAINDAQLTHQAARNDHVETVGA